ncbi:hypothetical protein [Promicromonospora soli]|uniref:hypothetical protein n=1 Tax=Promicromonospora soli TaxID=2035533 RepID=UPI0016721D91|nr:hypothetical protein [Promicromonospora soli]
MSHFAASMIEALRRFPKRETTVRVEGHLDEETDLEDFSALAAGVALTVSVAVPGSAVPLKKAEEQSGSGRAVHRALEQQLTFHFRSGDKVTYTVVRGGTTVTGTD